MTTPAQSDPGFLVCLHRAPGVIGTLIRWQTRGAYSHASLLFPDFGVVESREGAGVHRLPGLRPRKGETIDVFAVKGLTGPQYQAALAFASAQIGKPYDYTMVARFISRRQAARKESGKWFCSELAFASLLKAGVELLRGTEPWEVSPGMLARSPLLIPRHRVFHP